MKLGVVIEETWDFFNELYADFGTRYETRLFARRRLKSGPFHTRINNALLRSDMQSFLAANDVVFFEWASELLILASHLPKRCPIVTRLHRYELYQWADRINWDAVDQIILVSEAKRREFVARFPNQAHKIAVVPVGVDLRRFDYSERAFDPAAGVNVGTLCHLAPRKRVYELILAFSELAQQYPQLHLHIAGGAGQAFRDYEEALHFVVDQLNLQDRISFYGNIKETWNWYPKIDVFVSNSYSEGLQVAPMEAMAMGCSVLSHHWHGADELVPRENLYLTDHELAAQLAAYLVLPAVEKQAAAHAMRQRACDLFDVYDKIPRINQVIADALGQRPAAKTGPGSSKKTVV
ncbi:MAG: glycosyltransferase family 4 protein [Caldilineaceae bacterium]